MTPTALPSKFATNTNYSTGPDSGTATKVDPASTGNGFVAGTAIAPQHMNFLLNQENSFLRRQWLLNAASPVQVLDAFPDGNAEIGVCMMPSGQLLVARWDSNRGAAIVTDWGRVDAAGDFISITNGLSSDVDDAASNGSVVVLVGTGGHNNVYTSNSGASFTAGGSLAYTGSYKRVVWNQSKSKWHTACVGTDNNVYSNASTPSAAWSGVASGASSLYGLAVLSNGNLYVLGDNGVTSDPLIRVSTDGAATFANDGTQIPNASTYEESGSMAGNGGSAIYHVGRIGTTELAICRRTASLGWTLAAAFTNLNLAVTSFDARPRILMCADTGLLVVACQCTVGGISQTLLLASLDGTDWLGPLFLAPASDVGIILGIGGGRLVASRDTAIYWSRGIGQIGSLV